MSEGRRVQDGDAIPIPQDGQQPGLGPNNLPVPPVRRQATPTGNGRDTSSWHSHVCNRSGWSCRRQMKRAPYLCAPSASHPAGQKKRPSEPSSATAAPPRSAEEADVKPARTGPAEDFRGIFSGCKIFWTRELFDAICILSRAESSKAEGKRPTDEGSAA